MSEPYIKEAASLLEQAKGAVAGGTDKVKEMAGNPDLQKLLPYLLAGGAGGVAGGVLSGKRKERAGETRGQYLTRILRNASVAAGLAGGGSYLAHEGFKKSLGSADLENPMTGTAGDQGPLAAGLRDKLFSPLTAGAAGIAGLAATAKAPVIGANPNVAEHEKQLFADLKSAHGGKLPDGIKGKEDLTSLGRKSPGNLQALLRGHTPTGDKVELTGTPALASSIQRNAHAAGVNIHDPGAETKLLGRKVKGLAHKATEMGRLPSALLGRTTGRRLGRAGVGTVAALIPAIVGSILTNQSE